MQLKLKFDMVFPEGTTIEEADNIVADIRTATKVLMYESDELDRISHFDRIRMWAKERGIYTSGDPKTQTLKLAEEVGELSKAILNNDTSETIDGIGDCVVVLTNLAELCSVSIEDCIRAAWQEIKDRKGKMENGTFKKSI